MPAYDFKCGLCGIVREVTLAYGEDVHPICCDESMEKVYSPVGVIFKGNGFYHNDKSKP